MRGRFRRHRVEPQELNITAFMNLMVILVPFLLITAVFTRLTILELHLPAGSSGMSDSQQLQLEVTIRSDALEIGERSRGVIKRIDKTAKGHDTRALTQVLQQVKEKFPDKTNATILSEPSTSYETMVQVMDAVRVYTVATAGSVTQYDLFPDISIGDAPGRAAAAPVQKGK